MSSATRWRPRRHLRGSLVFVQPLPFSARTQRFALLEAAVAATLFFSDFLTAGQAARSRLHLPAYLVPGLSLSVLPIPKVLSLTVPVTPPLPG